MLIHPMLSQILIIEENDLERDLFKRALGAEGHSVLESSNITVAKNLLKNKIIHVIILGVNVPDNGRLDFIGEIKAKLHYVEIIVFTAQGAIDEAVKAIKLGAFDYMVKGDNHMKLLLMTNKAVLLAQNNFRENEKLAKENGQISFSSIIGESEAIKKAKNMALRVANTNANVLLMGETGVGKDLFAEAIHNTSTRRNNEFVAINCSSMSKDMLESELFGYKAGAFTGAIKDKKGLFEIANKGTIFLDEIGEMDITLQSRILRVLQNKSFIKLGDTKTTNVDYRIIAATNVDLLSAIKKGFFREDLYYRLSSFIIQIPPLIERESDIELLIDHFLKIIPQQLGILIHKVNRDYIEKLKNSFWKGNIRELINVIERSIILSDGQLHSDLLDMPMNTKKTWHKSLDDIEQAHIQSILNECAGNKRLAARKLGISISTLYRKLGE